MNKEEKIAKFIEVNSELESVRDNIKVLKDIQAKKVVYLRTRSFIQYKKPKHPVFQILTKRKDDFFKMSGTQITLDPSTIKAFIQVLESKEILLRTELNTLLS